MKQVHPVEFVVVTTARAYRYGDKHEDPYATFETAIYPSRTTPTLAAYVELDNPDQEPSITDADFAGSNPLVAYRYPLFVWALTILYVLILAISVIANLITISYYFMNKSRQFVANPYIFSLLIADLIWPMINVPYSVVHVWTPFWLFGRIACEVIPFCQVILPSIISLTLCAIAVERYFTVTYPFRNNPMLKTHISILAIAIIWGLPIIGNFFLLFGHELMSIDNENKICAPVSLFNGQIAPQQVTTIKIIQSAIFLVGIPGLLFPFCYGRIILKVIGTQSKRRLSLSPAVRGSTNRPRGNSEEFNSSGIVRSQPRSATENRTRIVTMISVCGQLAHFTCWTPIVIFQIWHVANNYPLLSPKQIIAFKLCTLLASANPAWNSLSYTAVLRHRLYQPRRMSRSRHASTFGLITTMVGKNGRFLFNGNKRNAKEDSKLVFRRHSDMNFEISPIMEVELTYTKTIRYPRLDDNLEHDDVYRSRSYLSNRERREQTNFHPDKRLSH